MVRMVKALRSPFFRHQRDPRGYHLVREGRELLPLEEDLPLREVHAVDGARELRLSRAHEAVESDDFPLVDLEGNVPQLVVGEVADLQDGIPAFALPGHVLLEDGLPDHHLDQLRPVLDLGHWPGVDMLSIAHHRDVVAELENLVEPVRDVNDGHVLFPQAS